MKHTLKDFLSEYNSQVLIQLIIGKHIISIDTRVKGSTFIIKHFYNETFTYVNSDDNFLVLKI